MSRTIKGRQITIWRACFIACSAFVVLALGLSCSKQTPPDEIRAVSISVDSLLARGDTLQALRVGRQIMPSPSSTVGNAPESSFKLFLVLAQINTRAGLYDEAERLYVYVLKTLVGTDSTSLDHQISALQEYGFLCIELGDETRAKQMLESALEKRRVLYGQEHWRYGIGCDALAMLEMRFQAWPAAEEHLRQSIALYEKAGPVADSLKVKSLTNLATVNAEIGKPEGERSAIIRVQEMLDEVATLNPATRALIHNALSVYYDRKGDYEEGLRHQITATELLSQSLGPRNPTTMLTRANLLVSYYSLDKQDEMDVGLARLYDDLGTIATESANIADACRIVGSFYLNRGELVRANTLLTRANRLYATTGNPNSRDRADCLVALAQLKQKQSNDDSAFVFGKGALAIGQANFSEVFDNLAESEAFAYSRQYREISDFYMSLLHEQQDSLFRFDGRFAETVLRTKNAVTDGLTSRNRILHELRESGSQTLLDSVMLFRKRLSSLYAGIAGQDSAARSHIEQTLRDIERIQRTLARQSAQYRQIQELSDVQLEAVCSAIPDSAIVIEYFRYVLTDKDDVRNTNYAAVVLSRRGHIANIDLGAAEEIDLAAHRWVDDLAVPQMLSSQRTTMLTQNLQDLVWNPVAPYLANANLVFVSTDGTLGGIAFQAFRSSEGRYVIEDYPIHYLSAARDLTAPERSRQSSMPLPFVAFADPDFRFTKSTSLLSKLAGTRVEAEAAIDTWKNTRSEEAVGYFGSTASESEFEHIAKNAGVLYIASHGDRGLDSSAAEQELLLARQALFLAGDSLGDSDGVLTAGEIANMDLRNVRLVVLSACETAAGAQFDGEGCFSLRRAFQSAGAGSVVSALWRVDDQSTAEIMKLVFTDKSDSLPVALQHACKIRLSSLRSAGGPMSDHPYLWAGILSSGNWKM